MSDFKEARTEYRIESDLHLLFWGDDPEAVYCANGSAGEDKVETLARQLNNAYIHRKAHPLPLPQIPEKY